MKGLLRRDRHVCHMAFMSVWLPWPRVAAGLVGREEPPKGSQQGGMSGAGAGREQRLGSILQLHHKRWFRELQQVGRPPYYCKCDSGARARGGRGSEQTSEAGQGPGFPQVSSKEPVCHSCLKKTLHKLEAMMRVLQAETAAGTGTPTAIADSILNITGMGGVWRVHSAPRTFHPSPRPLSLQSLLHFSPNLPFPP